LNTAVVALGGCGNVLSLTVVLVGLSSEETVVLGGCRLLNELSQCPMFVSETAFCDCKNHSMLDSTNVSQFIATLSKSVQLIYKPVQSMKGEW